MDSFNQLDGPLLGVAELLCDVGWEFLWNGDLGNNLLHDICKIDQLNGEGSSLHILFGAFVGALEVDSAQDGVHNK